jgi:arylsulfatase A-like enzyme
MLRRLLDTFAADLAGLGAVVLVFGMAFAVARLTALPQPIARSSGHALSSEGVSSAVTQEKPRVTSGEPAKPSPPKTFNVILITVDTLRSDIGFMGYPRPVSPNIDALAARAVVYEHVYAMASFTPKCLGPLLIGRYVSETKRDYEHYTHFFPENLFVAERLQAEGARTFGVVSHRYFGMKKGFEQGFDVWDTTSIPPKSSDNEFSSTSEQLTNAAIGLLSSARADDIPVNGASAIPRPRDGKARGHFFAWIHYLDPHLPYVAHTGAPDFGAMGGPGIPRERAPYDGEVWFTDQHIGRLLKHIAAQPWAADTAILFTADHGEAFGEHGHKGHGRELWEPLVHVPFILYVPGIEPRRIPVKRSHIDVVPTILELMGLVPTPELRGKSLLADVAGAPKSLAESDLYIDMPEGPYNEMRRAIVTGPSPGLKLIDFGGGHYQLFDLGADPGELHSLAADKSRLAEATAAMSKMRAGIKEVPALR